MKPQVGKILDNNKIYTRDAIHVPIIPCIVGDLLLWPGERVSIVNGFAVPSDTINKSIGIADPFLTVTANPGQKIYVFLKPQSVKSLWYDWTHKDIDNEEQSTGNSAPKTGV